MSYGRKIASLPSAARSSLFCCMAAGLLLSTPIANGQTITINFDIFGLNENQIELDDMLVDTCDSIGQTENPNAAAEDLIATCDLLDPLNDEDAALASGLDRLIPEETFAISDSLTDASDLQVTNVQARINSLRRRDLEENRALSGNSGGGAASGLRSSNLEPFLNSQFSTSDIDGNRLQQDAELSTNQLTAGADYRISDRVIAGAGLGLFQHQTDFRSTAGGSSVDGVNVTLFGTFMQRDQSYIDVVFDIGSNNYNLSRQINLEGNSQVMASADTQSSSLSLTLGTGSSFRVSEWDLNSYIRVGFVSASVDGYRERTTSTDPGFGSTLRVGSQSIRSITASAGVGAARSISTRWAVLVPQFTMELEVESQNKKDSLSAFFLADPNQTTFTVQAEERDTEYFNIGLGGVAVFAAGRSAYAYYETRLAHDLVSQRGFKAGLRIEF